MNGEGWAWPSSRVWGGVPNLSGSLGHRNSDSQHTRIAGTLDHHHQTPQAQLKPLRPREGKALALGHTVSWWGN